MEDGDTGVKSEMTLLGLPTGFASARDNKLNKKVEVDPRNAYRCDVCDLTLNSQVSLQTHLEGARHAKRAKANVEIGGKKAEDIRLSDLIGPLSTPSVGLGFVREILACSSVEMGAWYECRLCTVKGRTREMMAHVIGIDHRKKFVNKVLHQDVKNMSPECILAQISSLGENHRCCELVETIYSDELYPWPPGKAPWDAEMGGIGKPPTAVEYPNDRDQQKAKSLDINQVDDVTNATELDHYYNLALAIHEKISDFHLANCDPDDQDQLDTLAKMTTMTLQAMKSVKVDQRSIKAKQGSIKVEQELAEGTSKRRSTEEDSNKNKFVRFS